MTGSEFKSPDLSGEIAEMVGKSPGDRVTCTRVGDDRYRCNWWAAQGTSAYDNPAMAGLLVTTHRVRKSQYFRATKTAEGLTIEPAVTRAARGED